MSGYRILFFFLLQGLIFISPAANAGTDILVGTYLGNAQRHFYGNHAPDTLNLIWKTYIGHGETTISRRAGTRTWYGSGWTGQPLIVNENDRIFLLHGALDHHLRKIEAATGEVIWKYRFDDVIKGTGSLWQNPAPDTQNCEIVIIQGSRLGAGRFIDMEPVPSLRGICFQSGRELWRLNVHRTRSYSRDADGSPLVLGGKAFMGLENGTFVVFDPDPAKAVSLEGMIQPVVYHTHPLYTSGDVHSHGGNLVTESSPCLLGDHIYVTAGSGHVYGYNIQKDTLDWEFFTGSDMDGSPVVARQRWILVPVERQYVTGQGGLFMLDPRCRDTSAVVWYYPTGNRPFHTWQGGIVGSACVNDMTRWEKHPRMAAFIGIDGYLVIVQYDAPDLMRDPVWGPNKKHKYRCPREIDRIYIGPSISTPVWIGDKLIAAGYGGLYLFRVDANLEVHLLSRVPGVFESTPVVWAGRLYIGSRDGYLYCYGDIRYETDGK